MSKVWSTIVVGGGIAGLNTAQELSREGKNVLLLEASLRLVGRVHTVQNKRLNKLPFDLGAAWLHCVQNNPLVEEAYRLGIRTQPFQPPALVLAQWSADRVEIGEQVGREEVAELWNKVVEDYDGPDITLEKLGELSGLDQHPAWANFAQMEGPMTTAQDFGKIGLMDWQANALEEENAWPDRGMQEILAKKFDLKNVDIYLEHGVSSIDTSGDTVMVQTKQGLFSANSIVVTVSNGVLASNSIGFNPPLAQEFKNALELLPMAHLSKIAFIADAPELLEIKADTIVEVPVQSNSSPAMFFLANSRGSNLWIGLCGGDTAFDLAQQGERAMLDFAGEQLSLAFGPKAKQWIREDNSLSIQWANNPLFQGSYTYGLPGAKGARAILAQPWADGKLVFAGEATHQGAAGCVHAAYLSGFRASQQILEYLAKTNTDQIKFG